ncbi:hypothetical protein C8F01DRAFT_1165302 [Mycena amicta]|nr:hypothetical protein C8F01DRAFT_1165302 [Mycena amicta]
MGRWSQHDEDSARLPEGMTRIGYDSDTQRYYFRDRDGSVWEGAEGAEFSEMRKISNGDGDTSGYDHDDVEAAAPRRADGYAPLATDSDSSARYAHSPYRTLFPFFLLISVVLLLIWRLVLSPSLTAPAKNLCPDADTRRYIVEPGDSCWEIAQAHGVTLEQLRKANSGLECERLMPGMTMCVPTLATPEKDKDSKRRRGN